MLTEYEQNYSSYEQNNIDIDDFCTIVNGSVFMFFFMFFPYLFYAAAFIQNPLLPRCHDLLDLTQFFLDTWEATLQNTFF